MNSQQLIDAGFSMIGKKESAYRWDIRLFRDGKEFRTVHNGNRCPSLLAVVAKALNSFEAKRPFYYSDLADILSIVHVAA